MKRCPADSTVDRWTRDAGKVIAGYKLSLESWERTHFRIIGGYAHRDDESGAWGVLVAFSLSCRRRDTDNPDNTFWFSLPGRGFLRASPKRDARALRSLHDAVFLLVLRAVAHEAGEHFRWEDKRVCIPHTSGGDPPYRDLVPNWWNAMSDMRFDVHDGLMAKEGTQPE